MADQGMRCSQASMADAMGPAAAWMNAQHNTPHHAQPEAHVAWPEAPDDLRARMDLHGGVVDEEEATRLAIEVRQHSGC